MKGRIVLLVPWYKAYAIVAAHAKSMRSCEDCKRRVTDQQWVALAFEQYMFESFYNGGHYVTVLN